MGTVMIICISFMMHNRNAYIHDRPCIHNKRVNNRSGVSLAGIYIQIWICDIYTAKVGFSGERAFQISIPLLR
jgi:hypothetical protein